MTRSIVGRFLILAVLLVSLGVIAQAALIISKGSAKAVAKADAPAAPAAPPVAVAAVTPAPPPPAQPAAPAQATAAPAPVPPVLQAAAAPAPVPQVAAPAADAVVRVVYPGPLGDGTGQPRKFVAAAAPLTAPATPSPAASPPAAAPAAAQAAAPSPAPAAPKPAPVVVASADADTQPASDPPAPAKGGVDLNKASVDALNHLGGGHIGQTIVKHRPYSSVEDLVKKRVVRRSVYEQIKNQVAAR